MNAPRLSAKFATDYLLHWKIRSLSCPEHCKELEMKRRMAAWVEMALWWESLQGKV